MSAPVAADVLRELGAETRTFPTARKALLWYVEQLQRKLSATRDPGAVNASQSVESRNTGRATYAAIGRCLNAAHRSDSSIKSQAMLEAVPLRAERLLYLVALYEHTHGNGEELARRWAPDAEDDPRWRFLRWCRTTERVLRHRMEADRLLEEDA